MGQQDAIAVQIVNGNHGLRYPFRRVALDEGGSAGSQFIRKAGLHGRIGGLPFTNEGLHAFERSGCGRKLSGLAGVGGSRQGGEQNACYEQEMFCHERFLSAARRSGSPESTSVAEKIFWRETLMKDDAIV
jgi:hypothetical protein